MTEQVIANPKTQITTAAELAAARESRGMSQVDISQRIKLQVRQVAALEEERWDALPGKSFVRGALRSYGKLLDVDVSPLLESIGGFAEPAAIQAGLRRDDASMSRSSGLGYDGGSRGSPILWVIAGLIGVVGLVLYFGSERDTSRLTSWLPSGNSSKPAAARPEAAPVPPAPVQSAAVQAAPTSGSSGAGAVSSGTSASPAQASSTPASGAAAGAMTPPASGSSTTTASVAQSSPSTPAASSGSAASTAGSAASGAAASAMSSPAPAAAAGAASSPTASPSTGAASAPTGTPSPGSAAAASATTTAGGRGVLNFKANEDSWIEVRQADGSPLHNAVVKAGGTLELKGNPPYRIVLGNPGKLEFVYEGKTIDLAPHTSKANIARMALK